MIFNEQTKMGIPRQQEMFHALGNLQGIFPDKQSIAILRMRPRPTYCMYCASRVTIAECCFILLFLQRGLSGRRGEGPNGTGRP